MRNKKYGNKYWENEEGEVVEFGNSNKFMRCYDKAGKLQIGKTIFNSQTGEKIFKAILVINCDDFFTENEDGGTAAGYLKEMLEDWKEMFYEQND